ncbi:MAG TPA: hypothetical protein VMU26_16745, partial [Candidatus Polarisedimenticolia bacterium]|nr:hypothetical protein [Candidatus Polarisedimenticolia bacterium]
AVSNNRLQKFIDSIRSSNFIHRESSWLLAASFSPAADLITLKAAQSADCNRRNSPTLHGGREPGAADVSLH